MDDDDAAGVPGASVPHASGRIAMTPAPPYTAVVFTSLRSVGDQGYVAAAAAMDRLAREQPGYLGIESARDDLGITVSYWRDEASARAWKRVAAHLVVQRQGRATWYSDYRVRIATVHREYGADTSDLDGRVSPIYPIRPI